MVAPLSKDAVMKLETIDLPHDAMSLLDLSRPARLLLEGSHKVAEWLRLFEYPRDIGVNPRRPEKLTSDPLFVAYWTYKTRHPISRAKKGSGIEGLFERQEALAKKLLRPCDEPDGEITLSFVGDLMATKGVERSRDILYDEVAEEIFGADVAFANLESTFADGGVEDLAFRPGDTPKINLNPAQYEALIQHKGRSFDIVNLANNHILDCGEAGVQRTWERLERDEILQVGTNRTAEEASKGVIIKRKGFRIGYVATTYSVNARPFPRGKPYFVNVTPFHMRKNPDLAPLKRQIEWCRRQACDFVVLSLHWGLEFELYPHPDQLLWAHELAEAGADLIVGHHPHVPQPMEYYRAKRDGGRVVPIAYSLGNLTPIFSSVETTTSTALHVTLSRETSPQRRSTRVTALEERTLRLYALSGRSQLLFRVIV